MGKEVNMIQKTVSLCGMNRKIDFRIEGTSLFFAASPVITEDGDEAFDIMDC